MNIKNEIFEMKVIEAVKVLLDTDMPIKEGYKVIELVDVLQKQHEKYMKAKEMLIKKYCDIINPKKGEFKIKEETKDEFLKEMDTLIKIEFDTGVEKIQIPENLNLKPKELMILKPIIDFKSTTTP
jgi:hypothetical protein